MINRPNNSKALIVIIIVLLATNFAGLALFFMNKPSKEKGNSSNDRKNAMQVYLKKDIGFSNQQIIEYDTLVARHRRGMGLMFDVLKKEKETRLKYISQFGFEDSAIATAVSKAVTAQQMLETKMLMHLKDIRNICTAEQKIKFDSSVYKVFSKKNAPERKK